MLRKVLCLQYACKKSDRNKRYNKAKFDNKNVDFMPFIQNDINGHIEWGSETFGNFYSFYT